MTRITIADARRLAERGLISQEDLEYASTPRKLITHDEPYRTRTQLATAVEFNVPIELQTENALRAMHPIHRRKREKGERNTLRLAWMLHFRNTVPELPVIVTWTRIGRRMDEHDSLRGAFKHLTDEVTELLGLKNDDTKEITWQYQQEPRGGNPKSIRIRVEPAPSAAAPTIAPVL